MARARIVPFEIDEFFSIADVLHIQLSLPGALSVASMRGALDLTYSPKGLDLKLPITGIVKHAFRSGPYQVGVVAHVVGDLYLYLYDNGGEFVIYILDASKFKDHSISAIFKASYPSNHAKTFSVLSAGIVGTYRRKGQGWLQEDE